MDILDYEDTVTLSGPDGAHHTARLSALVAPASALEAGLGPAETSLAFQRWLEVKVVTPASLDVVTAVVVFADGSRRDAELTSLGYADGRHTYRVKFAVR